MSPQDAGRGHERARELAALRAGERLAPDDEAWLADHLDFCDACAAVALEYEAQHDLFAGLRAWTPEPPRDLWARTAAAIDAERGRGPAPRRARRFGRPVSLRLSLAPLAAVVAVVVVVGAGLLNSAPGHPGGVTAGPTPIALAGTADLQVIVRDSNGNLHLLSRPVKEVCPVGVDACGAQPTFAVTAMSGVTAATTLQGAISPSGDKMVVVAQDGNGDGVYILPVGSAHPVAKSPAPSAPTPSPTITAVTASATATATASSTASASSSATASPSPAVASATATSTPSPSPTASVTAAAAASASPAPSETPEAVESAADSPSPSSAPASASPSPSVETSPLPSSDASPSADVSPSPDAALRIASGVTVVGSPAYAPDGLHLAFSAMPSDGSTGPDIYVWAPGDKTATAITTDHGSWLAGWSAAGIVGSRVDAGLPSTFLLDPSTGTSVPLGSPGTWLPTVSPDGKSAAWWDGTVKRSADGLSWVPDGGSLVMGAWPNTVVSSRQVLAKGQIAAWQVRWSDDGTALAVWVDADGSGAGKLSLYGVDATGAPDLANPMLDSAPASPGFSLRTGRLAWTTPDQTAPSMVEVLAWSGKTVGRLEVPAGGSGTVLP